jgi:sensor domain CHASE-containing protein
MMATRPYVASIQLAPQGRVTDIYPSDEAGAGKVDLSSLPDRLESLRYSRDTGIATMQGPFNLTDDYQAIALRQPIYLTDAAGNRTFWASRLPSSRYRMSLTRR